MMRKLHVKVVLDVFVDADDSVNDIGDIVSSCVEVLPCCNSNVDIQDFTVESSEVTRH